MAEAHSAVAFSFHVTPEGVHVHVNHEALWAVWHSGVRSWKKWVGRMKNHMINGVYPASPASWFVTVAIVVGLFMAGFDVSYGTCEYLRFLPGIRGYGAPWDMYLSWVVAATIIWFSGILAIRYLLMILLTYHGWMYDPRGKMSLTTKIWVTCVKILVGRKPLLYGYQGSMPKLPLPALKDTMKRYLLSVRPLLDDEKYQRMEKLVAEFQDGIGPRLQRYLVLKSWWASNYVSDWWEEYVYLRGRSPIMVNSNFYGLDAVVRPPTSIQSARAANIVYCMLQYRRQLDREELAPIMLNKTVPLCCLQWERQFNTTRIPGIETDTLVHHRDSKHIVVYHRGRYFKVYIYHKHQLLSPCQIEAMLQKIIDDASQPAPGEQHLAAVTAGDRVSWAKARSSFFTTGINKTSLDAIEKAAFVLVLDEDPQDFDRTDSTKLDKFGRAMLHGKGYDRWFDKSFTLVVCANGRIGFNAEHSWADAPIMGHMWESTMYDDRDIGYREDGHTKGTPEFAPPNPVRLQWELPTECQDVIERSLEVASNLLNDVDLHLLTHDHYGKGFIKNCSISPDAYIQMALQVAYYRDAGKFCLTYEASMTRLFREGRTETVRSCTIESCAFVRSIDNPNVSKAEKMRLLQLAGEAHQTGYRNAMTGRGVDRHLFTLYVVSKYLDIDSPFLKEVLSEPWRLSTSQTPHQQTEKMTLEHNPDMISAGGGFGPVADDGYGVSYIIAGENVIFFHISSKRSCPITDSTKFGRAISRALDDMRQLFL